MRTTYEYTLDASELARLMQHAGAAAMRKTPLRGMFFALNLILSAAFGLIVMLGIGLRSSHEGMAILIAATAGFMALLASPAAQRYAYRHLYDRNHLVGTPRTLVLDHEGIRISSSAGEVFYRWAGIARVEAVDGAVLLFLDNFSHYPIASSAFGDDEERGAFVEHARAMIAAAPAIIARASATSVESAAPAPAVEPPSNMSDISADAAPSTTAAPKPGNGFVDALRLAFLRPVAAERLTVSWARVALFAMATLAIPVLALMAASVAEGMRGMPGSWLWSDVPGALFQIPVLLLAAIACAYAASQPSRVPALFQTFLMAAFMVDLIHFSISGIAGHAWYSLPSWLRDLAPWWLALASTVAAVRLLEASHGRRGRLFLICLVFIGVLLALVPRERSPWQPDVEEGDKPAAPQSVAQEDIFYLQPQLLDDELDAVEARHPGAPNLFFIGMAGYGEQAVFRREVDAVTQLFEDRFGAEGHTVRLVNSRDTLNELPIASVTSLRASLARHAEMMDRNRDILFLFLTSHGSDSHRLSLNLWPMQFNELDPATLRAALDESGIRNRVIVVSACYSGGFIDALKDDDTLVITAAARDRTSFGCSNEADWTYFGDAYFNQALRNTDSFIEAFDIAAASVAEREKREGFTPSQPQISVGSRIAASLEQWQRNKMGWRGGLLALR